MSTNAVVAFLDQHSCNRRCYLGDGVYAGHDGFQIWLVTDRSFEPSVSALETVKGLGLHYIALDDHVQTALANYLNPAPQHRASESSD